ncbi:MAG: hypothetical protein J3K34DRAFT_429848 [Monoraphidium minutum]|nr:MAG: hypothetical protein J3K34DRAFT_429848 [Monoraphidium minutum]
MAAHPGCATLFAMCELPVPCAALHGEPAQMLRAPPAPSPSHPHNPWLRLSAGPAAAPATTPHRSPTVRLVPWRWAGEAAL